MRPTWLIEAEVYGNEVLPLIDEVRRQGMIAEVVPYSALRNGASLVVGGKPVVPDHCVIGYGTFPFAQQILLHHAWIPGAWCSSENLDCSRYFAHFGRYLLNQNYAIMPGVEAIRQQDWLFTVFGNDDCVFARPTSCHKLFVGRCIDQESFAQGLAPTRYDLVSQVVIASPKTIGREWRLIVINDRVISGSQYAEEGSRAISSDCPAEIKQYAESILAAVRWRPDPAFMLDVCESEGKLWLVELNSFSGSWLYQCDLSAVVTAASELAQHAWQNVQTNSRLAFATET